MLRSMDSNSQRDWAKQLKFSKLDDSIKKIRGSQKRGAAFESTNHNSQKSLQKMRQSNSSYRSKPKNASAVNKNKNGDKILNDDHIQVLNKENSSSNIIVNSGVKKIEN